MAGQVLYVAADNKVFYINFLMHSQENSKKISHKSLKTFNPGRFGVFC
jgi:hypothetical protein